MPLTRTTQGATAMTGSTVTKAARDQHAPMTWADYFRYWVALAVGFTPFVVFFWLVWFLDLQQNGKTEDSFGWFFGALLPYIVAVTIGIALGHALPSRLRGRVSLRLSSLLTGAVLVGAIVASGLSGVFFLEMETSNPIGLAMFFVMPAIVIAHLLRLFVPPLRPHVDGKAVRYFGHKEPNRVEHQGVTDRA